MSLSSDRPRVAETFRNFGLLHCTRGASVRGPHIILSDFRPRQKLHNCNRLPLVLFSFELSSI